MHGRTLPLKRSSVGDGRHIVAADAGSGILVVHERLRHVLIKSIASNRLYLCTSKMRFSRIARINVAAPNPAKTLLFQELADMQQ